MRDYSAFLLSSTEKIKDYLAILPKHSYLYLVSETEEFYHPKVLIVRQKKIRDQANIIFHDIFYKRLGYTGADEKLKELKERVNILASFNKCFTFSGGGIACITNFWNNLLQIIKRSGSAVLQDIAKGKPVVIVSSGPSLNKNIHILKEYQNKAVIMACGTAIGALKKNDIIPHFLITVDPCPYIGECINPALDEKTILITTAMSDNTIIEKHRGRKAFIYTDETFKIAGELVNFLDIAWITPLNISVTTSALSIALFMGAGQVIFIGQDMALEDKVYYADGVRGTEAPSNCEVVGLDGKTYKTTLVLRDISEYFNTLVPVLINETIINATEGGLGIAGAEVLTLQETADKYFKEEIPKINLNEGTVIDKSKVLAKISLIKKEVEELIVFTKLFKHYIDSLFENNIDFEFIKEEINEWFDNLRNKKGYQYLAVFMDWVWYTLITAETESEKRNSINIFNTQLEMLIGLIDKQIKAISESILS